MQHPDSIASADFVVGPPTRLAAWLEETAGEEDECAVHIRARVDERDVAYLEWIGVNGRRGRGVGTRLLRSVLEGLDSTGVQATYLWSAPDAEDDPSRLERWYRSFGFVRVEDDPDLLRETVPMVREGMRPEGVEPT